MLLTHAWYWLIAYASIPKDALYSIGRYDECPQ